MNLYLRALLRQSDVTVKRLASRCFLLLLLAMPSSAAEPATQTVIPQIANIGRAQIGYTTMDELEKLLGPGKPITGGHPHGARLWRVRGTDWIIHADAFEYSDHGIVVDNFDIYRKRNPGRNVPFARCTPKDLRWQGQIAVGMSAAKLAQELGSISAAKSANGFEINKPGNYQLGPYLSFKTWTAGLDVTNGILTRIRLDAR